MPSVKLKENVRHNQKDYGIGETIHDLSEKDANRLVELKAGYVVEESGNPIEVDNPLEPNSTINPPDEDEIASLKEDLKNEFEYSELKKAAKEELNLEFAGNISHDNLITLIIESGKANDLFEEVEQ